MKTCWPFGVLRRELRGISGEASFRYSLNILGLLPIVEKLIRFYLFYLSFTSIRYFSPHDKKSFMFKKLST